MIQGRITAIILAILVGSAGPVHAQQEVSLVLGTGALSMDDENSPVASSNLRIIRELFRRLGVSVEIRYEQPARMVMLANSGRIDGIAYRISGQGELYPNLIEIEESLITVEFVGFSRKADIETTSWESLRNYQTAYIRGWDIFASNLEGFDNAMPIGTTGQLFDLLVRNRIDIALYGRIEGERLLALRGNDDIVALSPPLINTPLHIYLHRDHAALAEAVGNELKAMKADGTFYELLDSRLYPYLDDLPEENQRVLP